MCLDHASFNSLELAEYATLIQHDEISIQSHDLGHYSFDSPFGLHDDKTDFQWSHIANAKYLFCIFKEAVHTL